MVSGIASVPAHGASSRQVSAWTHVRVYAADTYTVASRAVRRDLPKLVVTAGASAATVGASAWACSQSVTPVLLAFKTALDAGANFLSAVPMVGPALGGIIGTGAFAWVASAALLAGVVAVLTGPRDGSVTLPWLVAHCALGLALSPLMLPGIAAAAGLGSMALAGATAAGLSAIVGTRLLSGRSTWQDALGGVTLSLTLAPFAAKLGAGIAAGVALPVALQMMAAGLIVGALYALYSAYPRLCNKSTAFVETFCASQEDVNRAVWDIPRPAGRCTPEPTVFGVPPLLAGFAERCKDKERRGLPIGMPRALLHGPPGCGKTELARGLARELNARLVVVERAKLGLDGGESAAAANIHRIFSESRELQKQTGRPVVLFFDEAEATFTDRRNVGGVTGEERSESQIVTTLLQCLDGACKPPDDNLVVLAAANRLQAFDPAARDRFLHKIPLQAPGLEEMKNIMRTRLNSAFERQATWEEATLDRAAQDAVAATLSGRDVHAWSDVMKTRCAASDSSQPICINAAMSEYMPSIWRAEQVAAQTEQGAAQAEQGAAQAEQGAAQAEPGAA